MYESALKQQVLKILTIECDSYNSVHNTAYCFMKQENKKFPLVKIAYENTQCKLK